MTLEDTTVVAVALAEVSWATVAGIVPVVVPVEELQKKKKYQMIKIALLDLKHCIHTMWNFDDFSITHF